MAQDWRAGCWDKYWPDVFFGASVPRATVAVLQEPDAFLVDEHYTIEVTGNNRYLFSLLHVAS